VSREVSPHGRGIRAPTSRCGLSPSAGTLGRARPIISGSCP